MAIKLRKSSQHCFQHVFAFIYGITRCFYACAVLCNWQGVLLDVSTVSKKFKINLEGQNHMHFEAILSRNVKLFGIMASL